MDAKNRPARSILARFARELPLVGLLAVVATAAAAFLIPRHDDLLLSDLRTLQAGDAAPRTVKSPRAFTLPDQVTTERLGKEASERVKPTFDWIGGVGVDARERVEAAFRVMASGAGREPITGARADDFMLALQVVFDAEQLVLLSKVVFDDELRDATIMVVRTAHEHPLAEDKELLKLQAPEGIHLRVLTRSGQLDREENVYSYVDVQGLDEARAQIDRTVADRLAHLGVNERKVVALLAKRLLRPNLVPNERETQRRREQAAGQVKEVFIHIERGETVLRARQAVTPRHLLILQGIEGALAEEGRLQIPVGSALIVLLLLLALDAFRPRRSLDPPRRDFAFWTIAYVLALLLVFASFEATSILSEDFPELSLAVFRAAVPVAFAPLLVRFVSGRRVAFSLVPLVAFSAGWVMDSSLPYAAFALVGGVAAASTPPTLRPRRSLFRAGLVIGLAQALAVLALSLIHSRLSVTEAAQVAGAAMASGLIAALLTYLAMPIVEVLFALSTPLRHAALANLNHPLLRDLLVQAPGTYHHSIVVGGLAEVAARAVGADPLLARAGGYYHDIGKRKNPRAFAENAKTHEPSPAHVEARKIRQHVADGLALGAEHRLGSPILEIIAQHHGTGRVHNLLVRAREEHASGAGPAVDEADFTYSGPIPLTKEAGLVMLADAIESASSGLEGEPTAEQISMLASNIARELVFEGQLNECQLTLSEIHLAAAAMGDSLVKLQSARKGQAFPLPPPESFGPSYVVVRNRDDRPN
ncbi:MAG: HDIG domain-containing protein [Deltaproteobacteria bacterium]|nr:HDIG domain-containing protein [Deltaproteobacteria bacterium]